MTRRGGCLALAITPFAVLARVLRGRLGVGESDGLGVTVEREWRRGLVVMRAALVLPRDREVEVVRALALAVGTRAVEIGRTIGCVAVPDGEEPVLVARAPRLDRIADAYARAMLSGGSHRVPQLWLALSPGRYLAEAVDPYAPLQFSDDVAIGLLRSGLASDALWSVTRRDARATGIELASYSSLRSARDSLAISRRHLAGIEGWKTNRSASATAPRTAEKARLQR